MSVKLGLLALLNERSMYGTQLRDQFESRTGGTWPLNIGQVYTTLSRAERDGMVQPLGSADDRGRISYELTPAGREQVSQWWTTPVDRGDTPRDELVIKLALAVTAPGVDVAQVVQTQRTATMTHLRELTRLKSSALHQDEEQMALGQATSDDLAWLLVLENLIFDAEAEARWLDHIEARIAREAHSPHRRRAALPPSTDESAGSTNEATSRAATAEHHTSTECRS